MLYYRNKLLYDFTIYDYFKHFMFYVLVTKYFEIETKPLQNQTQAPLPPPPPPVKTWLFYTCPGHQGYGSKLGFRKSLRCHLFVYDPVFCSASNNASTRVQIIQTKFSISSSHRVLHHHYIIQFWVNRDLLCEK